MIVATIARDSINSPNMESNDAMILDCVSRELIAMEAEVIRVSSVKDIPANCNAVCHMSRNSITLKELAKTEKSGIKVINSTNAIKNCSRLDFVRILAENDIPQPQYKAFKDISEIELFSFPAWIKRGEGWSCHKDDVCFAGNYGEAMAAVAGMKERDIEDYIYTEHCQGDIIKFYGVGCDYFYFSYPDPEKSKFGLEKINGKPQQNPFDTNKLKEIAFRAAKAMGLQIYGGDCIVTADGDIFIIDINDFPSFSIVREEAAKEIARIIVNTIRE